LPFCENSSDQKIILHGLLQFAAINIVFHHFGKALTVQKAMERAAEN
jgi:hypothetical protein